MKLLLRGGHQNASARSGAVPGTRRGNLVVSADRQAGVAVAEDVACNWWPPVGVRLRPYDSMSGYTITIRRRRKYPGDQCLQVTSPHRGGGPKGRRGSRFAPSGPAFRRPPPPRYARHLPRRRSQSSPGLVVLPSPLVVLRHTTGFGMRLRVHEGWWPPATGLLFPRDCRVGPSDLLATTALGNGGHQEDR
jgi:hypothetical protein